MPQFSDKVVSAEAGKIDIETVQKKLKTIRILDYVALQTINQAEFAESKIFLDEPADLIIGIDITGNTQRHMYLLINQGRFDGRLFFAAHTFEATDWVLSNGLIMRYKGIPQSTKQRLIDYLDSEQTIRAPSCVSASCKLLFEKGDLQGPGKWFWFPSTFLRYLEQNNLKTLDRIIIKPEIYTLNADIHQIWNNLPRWKRVLKFFQGHKKRRKQSISDSTGVSDITP